MSISTTLAAATTVALCHQHNHTGMVRNGEVVRGSKRSQGRFITYLTTLTTFKIGMCDTKIAALLGSPTVSGGFLRQVFITTRTLPFFSAENVALHLPLEAGAT
jgi:outer membrane protein assembly factor BamE (lipoprotein component of BamABCDE complex)